MRQLLVLAVGVASVLAVSCGEDEQPPDDGVTDILMSPECLAFCQRLETTCPGTKCNPQSDCDPVGECLAEKRADLKCKADPKRTQLTCESMGYSTIGLCPDNRKLCR